MEKIPNYIDFIIQALEEESKYLNLKSNINNGILINAFKMLNSKNFNDLMTSNLNNDNFNFYNFHKQFRQIDVSNNANLDMIIWYTIQLNEIIERIIDFIIKNKENFKIKNINVLISDYIMEDL